MPVPLTQWHLYIVRTRDGALYTGVTTDLARRMSEHGRSAGRGARSLRGRAPLELAYTRRIGERGMALRVEARIKRLTRAAKQALIAASPDRRGLLRRLGLAPVRVRLTRASGRPPADRPPPRAR